MENIKFQKFESTFTILNPFNDFAEEQHRVEVRKDPLLGDTSVHNPYLRDKAKADMKALEEDVAKHGSQATPEQQADFERRRQNIEERRPGGVFPLIASDPPPGG